MILPVRSSIRWLFCCMIYVNPFNINKEAPIRCLQFLYCVCICYSIHICMNEFDSNRSRMPPKHLIYGAMASERSSSSELSSRYLPSMIYTDDVDFRFKFRERAAAITNSHTAHFVPQSHVSVHAQRTKVGGLVVDTQLAPCCDTVPTTRPTCMVAMQQHLHTGICPQHTVTAPVRINAIYLHFCNANVYMSKPNADFLLRNARYGKEDTCIPVRSTPPYRICSSLTMNLTH